MSDQVRFAAFRKLEDFVGKAENYAIPNFSELERVNNRMSQNLLYYQTNYFVCFLAIFLLMSIIHPLQIFSGLFLIIGLCVVANIMSNKSPEIQRFKKERPFLNLIIVVFISGFLFNLFGSLMIFLFSICLPLSVILIHAALRLRNLNNKIENKKELLGLTKSPMGLLLEFLDFFVNEKLKE
ncbi:PRA1 family 3 [Brachionus plicatilis]|nr:PRA1 family 3 [Brachionus plicatilis]